MTEVHQSHQHEHQHEHDHEHHDHDHPHDYDHHHEHGGHDHAHQHGLWPTIAGALHLPGYGHTHEQHDIAAISSDDNNLAIRTVWLALAALGVTTVMQIVIYVASGSVALLADTVHNLGDALNSIPLLIAFYLARRQATQRYTYGYGRAEDVAGVFIVLSIAFSAGYILWESVQKLINPQPLDNLPWIAAAAVVGFVGNEIVALLQIRVGRRIGSEAMVADGLHARTDGYTSLAVLVAAAGAAIGIPILDPIIGILIGITILFITRDAALSIWYRLMDAVDPKLVEAAEAAICEHDEVKALDRLQVRWLGHNLRAEVVIELDPQMSLVESETFADHIRHHLYHILPRLAEVTLSIVPSGTNTHETTHHQVAT